LKRRLVVEGKNEKELDSGIGLKRAAPPGVFFVRVANKGVKLDAASRLIDAGLRAAVFSVSCGGAAPFAKAMSERLAGKGLTGAVASDEWQLAGTGEGEGEKLVCPSSLKVNDESIK
jgi:hypothetical protein